jgi:hypothetical protein
MRNLVLIGLAACALSACGSSNNNNSSSSSSSSGGSSGSSSSSSSSSGGSSSSSGSSSSGSSSGSAVQGIYCGSFAGTSSSSSSSSSGSSSSSSSGSTSSFCSSSSSAANFFGLVQADGTALLFGKSSTAFILFQPASLTTSDFNVSVTAYGLNDTVINGAAGGTDTGTLSGSVTTTSGLTSTTTMTGTLTDTSGTSLSFNAQASSSDWDSAASLSSVAGSYTGSFTLDEVSYTPSLTISSTGAITGTDSSVTGCTYTGSVAVADTSHNDYSVTLTPSCIGVTFSGIGAYFSGLDNPGGLLAAAEFKAGLINGSSAIYLGLTK